MIKALKIVLGIIFFLLVPLNPSVHPREVTIDVKMQRSILANQIALQEITLEKRYGQLPTIMADPIHLRQVFLNTILNSCEAMQKDGRLKITTISSRKEKVVKVKIVDNGIGIAEEELPKVFDPFFTSKEQGTGLGLSVVYGIINSHHGTIQIKSKVRNGTTIIITLPTEIKASEMGPDVEGS